MYIYPINLGELLSGVLILNIVCILWVISRYNITKKKKKKKANKQWTTTDIFKAKYKLTKKTKI